MEFGVHFGADESVTEATVLDEPTTGAALMATVVCIHLEGGPTAGRCPKVQSLSIRRRGKEKLKTADFKNNSNYVL